MANPIKISGVVITFNEEQNIERCLSSMAPICDELLVVDSYSTDRTKEISLKLGARFIENKWGGFKEQKNFGQDKAQFDYVLQLDADEEVSEELATSILKVKEDAQFDGYIFNRFTNFCGKWIYHSGWYPDAKLRLYKKDKGNWTGLEPHPSVEMQPEASATKIRGDLFHYSYTSYEDLVTRSAVYAKQAAYAMQTKGKKASKFKLMVSPVFRFIKDYIFKRGFLDGVEGYMICKTSAHYTFLKYLYLYLLSKGKKIE